MQQSNKLDSTNLFSKPLVPVREQGKKVKTNIIKKKKSYKDGVKRRVVDVRKLGGVNRAEDG